MSQHAVIFLRHVVANRVKIGYTVSIELYVNNLGNCETRGARS